MNGKNGFRITPQIVLGIITIFVGTVFLLDNMDILHARDFLRYWAALLVIYGIVKISQPSGTPGRVFGLILAFVGAGMLADKLDLFYFRVWDYWPLILILLGGSLLWRGSQRKAASDAGAASSTNSVINGFTMLGGLTRNSNSQNFKGGELTTIMGGCEIDLRHAKIQGEAVFEMLAFWGGIDLKIPEDWTVVNQITPLLGGVEDKTRPPKETTQRLVLRGHAIMGGIEVSN